MTNTEAVNWIINISADIGKAEHRDLWHYEQALSEIREMLEAQSAVIRCKDCKYQDKGQNESESWNQCGFRPWLYIPTWDEEYCSHAERRTDE